jgi:selenocysteine lyase/cysteine desulfurase
MNTAAVGLVPLPVIQAAHARELVLATGGAVELTPDRERDILNRSRAAAAQLLGAPLEAIGISNSASEAMLQVAWWLKPRGRANIVTADNEFPAVTYPWLRVARETSLEVRFVDTASRSDATRTERLLEAIDRETIAVAVSHVSHATGERVDLEELASVAHDNDALLIVDASQSAGAIPIDLRSRGVDILVISPGKWLGSTFGTGICYLGPRLRDKLDAPFISWRSAADPYALQATTLALSSPVQRLSYANFSFGAHLVLEGALDYLLTLGIERVAAHSSRLVETLIEGLVEADATIITPAEPTRRAGIVCASFADRSAPDLVASMHQAGVAASARAGAIRFSVHHYNSANDVGRALEALSAAAAGQPS